MGNSRAGFSLGMRALLVLAAIWVACAAQAARYTPSDQVVTPAQVAEAIRNSPKASAWLRGNADAVASLAMFESGGHTSVYNGSCCYGILQMNASNIDRFADVSPEVFRNWSLQQQVDAWADLTSPLVNSTNPQRLIAAGTFDGRAVDGNLILSCIQLGVGNCGTMINSGVCGGFRDSNGTSICDMADAIASGGSPGGVVTPTPPGGFFPGGPGYTLGPPSVPITDAIRGGFEGGAGVSMDKMRSINFALLVVIALLVIGSAMVGVWRNYAKGAITHGDLMYYMQYGLIIVGLIAIVMTLF